MSSQGKIESERRRASRFRYLRDCLNADSPDHARNSLSELPPELLLLIGDYLSNQSLASLCFHNTGLRPLFANRVGLEMASIVLLQAAQAGDIETVKLALLEDEVDVNYSDRDKRTPLSFAAERGDIAMTQLLLKSKDIEIYASNYETTSPLDWASMMGNMELIDLLLAADVDGAQDHIESALAEATEHGHVKVVERLLEIAKRDPLFERGHGYGNLLCSATENGNETLVKLYLAAGVDPDARDDCGSPALCLASGFHGKIMQLLIEAGADVNKRDYGVRTPLIHAVTKGYKEGVEILLSVKSIDISVKDRGGWTAISIAKDHEYKKISKLLRAAQRKKEKEEQGEDYWVDRRRKSRGYRAREGATKGGT